MVNDYECEICYHPGKDNVVADALSRKERLKSRILKPLTMTIQSNLATQIRDSQQESLREENIEIECLQGMEKYLENKDDGTMYFMNRIWVPKFSDTRKLFMNVAHKTNYSIHLIADRMYLNMRNLYWWPIMKVEIATYVSKCLICAKFKLEH